MTTKVDFTDEEWTTLRRALFAPGLYVVAADPRSAGDTAREVRAMEQFYVNLRDQAQRLGLDNKLLEALVTDTSAYPPEASSASQGEGTPDLAALRQKHLDTIRQAAALLSAKASATEANGIKTLMYQLAGQTAAASKEGSFLGIGGQRVTDAERAALNNIASVLGINPGDAVESWPLPGEE